MVDILRAGALVLYDEIAPTVAEEFLQCFYDLHYIVPAKYVESDIHDNSTPPVSSDLRLYTLRV